MSKVLFKNCRYLISHADPVNGVWERGSLYIEGPEIKALGSSDQILAAYAHQPDLEILDASEKIVMPGLVDAHNHVGEAHALLIYGWLDEPVQGIVDATHRVYWPAHGWLDDESAYDLTMLGILNMLKHGATTHANAMPFPHASYAAAAAAGCRTMLHPQVISSFRLPDADGDDGYLSQTEEVIQRYHGSHDDLIRVGVHPNALYNCSERLLSGLKELAGSYGVQFATHVAESPEEKQGLDALWESDGGMIGHLHRNGFLNERALLFHGTLLEEHEIDLLAESGASLVHCPLTNAMFGHCAYLPHMIRAGLNVGLGTDCTTHNIFSVMLSVSQHHSIMPRELREVSPWMPFELATLGGARALGWADKIGTLEPGKRADVITIDLANNTSLFPLSREVLLSMVAMNGAGTEACDVMVDGVFLRKDGDFTQLDEEAILTKARERCQQFEAHYRKAKSQKLPLTTRLGGEFQADVGGQ